MHDVLAEVLATLQLSSTVYCQSEIRKTDWALHFAPSSGAVFHIVSAGGCWLALDEQTYPLAAGDVLVLPHGAAHRLYDRAGAPVCAQIHLDDDWGSACALLRWGDDQPCTILVCGKFAFSRGAAILPLLPAVLRFSAAATQDNGLHTTIAALIEEANAQRQGKATILHRLADILFVQIIRAWLAAPSTEARGWLAGLRDPQIALALSAMHAEPERAWTVERLAVCAAMSRSAFAARFTELVGSTPITYLLRWRMQLASGLLGDPALSLAQIAEQVGYRSEAAFSKAFKREQGISPAVYRRLLAR